MGKRMTRRKKVDRRAREAAARRRRLMRTGAIYLGVVALCILCLAILARLGRAPERQDTWYIQAGSLEIAAPGMDAPDAGPVAPAAANDGAESASEYAIPMPMMPSRASVAASAAPTASLEPTAAPTPTPSAAPTPLPSPEPTAVTITITAAGDCTLGGSVNQDTYEKFKRVVASQGYDYFFKNVRHIFQADDLTILNLEGPLTDVGTGRHGSYCFKGDPDYVQIMTGSSVELCNVANNHSLDFGKAGLVRTAEVLEQAGIGCCGYTKVYNGVVKGVRVTALGFDKWQNDTAGIVEAVRRERQSCDLLIVNMHWGREKVYEPMSQQKEWGRAAIDAGADLVVGTHSHVYGGVEVYKGKYIAYGLGNFCFGGNQNPTDKRCLLFQQTFVVEPDGRVGDGGINIIPCSISGMSNKNNLQPVVLQPEAGAGLLKAVAKYSNLNGGTPWMQNSYPEQIGLKPKTVSSAGVRAVNVFQTAQSQPVATRTPVVVTAAQEELDDDALVGALDAVEDEFEDGNYVQRADADYESGDDPFGAVDEDVYDEAEAQSTGGSRLISAAQIQSGVDLTQEQRRASEMEAKQALYLDQMRVE